MDICGYARKNDNEQGEFVELKECSIVCSLNEIDTIIDFLNHVRETHDAAGYCHSHYQDWVKCSGTDLSEPVLSDLIVITNIDKA